MYRDDENILKEFREIRNLTNTTINGYKTTIRVYTKLNGKSFYHLLKEAEREENKCIRWKNRKLKERLINFRTYLVNEGYLEKTVKEYMQRIQTLYRHYEIEIHDLPVLSGKHMNKPHPITFNDLPDRELIKEILDLSSPLQKALVLFMCSSGCAKKETLSLTIQSFIDSVSEYTNKKDIYEVIKDLHNQDGIVPSWNIFRSKTAKWYTTFCSPEATNAIIAYLLTRKDKLTPERKLFKINEKYLNDVFVETNNQLQLGKRGTYNRFRTHNLRKWHASMLKNDGMAEEDINDLQGKSKNRTDAAYFMVDPKKLKEKYVSHLAAVTINGDVNSVDIKSPEYLELEQKYIEKEDQFNSIEECLSKMERMFMDMDGLSDDDVLRLFR